MVTTCVMSSVGTHPDQHDLVAPMTYTTTHEGGTGTSDGRRPPLPGECSTLSYGVGTFPVNSGLVAVSNAYGVLSRS
jgi:hypothetical protein